MTLSARGPASPARRPLEIITAVFWVAPRQPGDTRSPGRLAQRALNKARWRLQRRLTTPPRGPNPPPMPGLEWLPRSSHLLESDGRTLVQLSALVTQPLDPSLTTLFADWCLEALNEVAPSLDARVEPVGVERGPMPPEGLPPMTVHKPVRSMVFDPDTQRLYGSDGVLVGQVHCPAALRVEDLRRLPDGRRHCDQCDRTIVDLTDMDEQAFLAMAHGPVEQRVCFFATTLRHRAIRLSEMPPMLDMPLGALLPPTLDEDWNLDA